VENEKLTGPPPVAVQGWENGVGVQKDESRARHYLFETDPRFIARIKALCRQYHDEGGTPLDKVRKELGLKKRR